MITVRKKGWHCQKCGHKWVPRFERVKPIICPRCHSAYWTRPRKCQHCGHEWVPQVEQVKPIICPKCHRAASTRWRTSTPA